MRVAPQHQKAPVRQFALCRPTRRAADCRIDAATFPARKQLHPCAATAARFAQLPGSGALRPAYELKINRSRLIQRISNNRYSCTPAPFAFNLDKASIFELFQSATTGVR